MGGYTRKEFVLNHTGQVSLKNLSVFLKDAEEKITILCECASDTANLTRAVEQIFLDFLSVYQFDCDTAILPEPFGHFESFEIKTAFLRRRLLAEDFNIHLGTVFCNYHDKMIQTGKVPDIILSKFVVDYPKLYEKALYDYFGSLLNLEPHYPFQLLVRADNREDRDRIIGSIQSPSPPNTPKAFVANYIFPSLIEVYLKEFFQNMLIDEKALSLASKYKKGNVTLAKEEMDVFKQLWRKKRQIIGTKEDMVKTCYLVFERYGLLEDPKSLKPLITGMSQLEKHKPLMLNGLLSNKYVEQHLLPGHLEIMRLLFSGERLNIRNNVMHGVNVAYDPFAICYSAVMLQIFWSIIGRNIFV